MNQIDKALYTKLTTSGATALLSSTTSVYNHIAPENADTPYIVFGKMAGVPEFTFGGVAFETTVYMVKGIDQSPSAKNAGSVASLIDAALNDSTLSIDGYTSMYLRRESAIDYAEVGPGGQVYQHRGAIYRIWADPA